MGDGYQGNVSKKIQGAGRSTPPLPIHTRLKVLNSSIIICVQNWLDKVPPNHTPKAQDLTILDYDFFNLYVMYATLLIIIIVNHDLLRNEKCVALNANLYCLVGTFSIIHSMRC